MTLSQADRMLLQRHLDGALDAAASAAFAARIAAEPELAQAAAVARALRAGFVAARGSTARPSGAFTANVVAAVRRLPSRQLLEQADVAGGAIGLCRRIVLAAAILAGLGLVWHSGLVRSSEPESLQAAPGDVMREVDRLDALPPLAEPRRGN